MSKKSTRFQLSTYDIKSYIEQSLIVIIPFIIANINDISLLLEQYTGDPEATAVLISAILLLLRKWIKNYEEKN